jgi:hypothetical protein
MFCRFPVRSITVRELTACRAETAVGLNRPILGNYIHEYSAIDRWSKLNR